MALPLEVICKPLEGYDTSFIVANVNAVASLN